MLNALDANALNRCMENQTGHRSGFIPCSVIEIISCLGIFEQFKLNSSHSLFGYSENRVRIKFIFLINEWFDLMRAHLVRDFGISTFADWHFPTNNRTVISWWLSSVRVFAVMRTNLLMKLKIACIQVTWTIFQTAIHCFDRIPMVNFQINFGFSKEQKMMEVMKVFAQLNLTVNNSKCVLHVNWLSLIRYGIVCQQKKKKRDKISKVVDCTKYFHIFRTRFMC